MFNDTETTEIYTLSLHDALPIYIKLSIDTKKFDETIKYKGSTESSFLAEKYLEEEALSFFTKLFSDDNETFLENLDNYKISILEKLENIEKIGRAHV